MTGRNGVHAVLALGANLGERSATLGAAVAELIAHPAIHLIEVSPVVATKPVGGPEGQPDYLNMVIEVETTLPAHSLLEHAHFVEAKHHRERTVRWGPRTLDVDIIVYGHERSDDPELTLPHPRASQRAFVLVPWAMMDPEAELGGSSVRELAVQAPDFAGVEETD